MPKISPSSAVNAIDLANTAQSSMELSTKGESSIQISKKASGSEHKPALLLDESVKGEFSIEVTKKAQSSDHSIKVLTKAQSSEHSIELSKKVQPSEHKTHVFLDQLEVDVNGKIVVMIGRVSDVNAVTGRYLSTDFVVSDSKGNAVHYTAKSNVAHSFLRLQEGGIYSVKNFVVLPNKDEFWVFKDDTIMLEFNGETTTRKVSASPQGYVRYPFQLVDFDCIQPVNNKYMIDVVGYVTNVGRTAFTKFRTKNLDFYLANQRGHLIRVTLWGGLGDVLVDIKTKHVGTCPVVLASVSPNEYNNKVYLSSSSSTVIYDAADIPCIQNLKAENNCVEGNKGLIVADNSQPRNGTLENLLIWARNRKNDSAMFHCKVLIENFRTRKGWNYPSCGNEKCRKGTSRQAGRWWCESCKADVPYPVFRYRLEVVVTDDTAHMVVVMFNETATELIEASADSLMTTQGDESDVEDEANLPLAIRNLIGTEHVLEIKSHTYFEYGSFESFNCWGIIRADLEDGGSATTPSPDHGDGSTTSGMKLTKQPPVITPMKTRKKDPHMKTLMQMKSLPWERNPLNMMFLLHRRGRKKRCDTLTTSLDEHPCLTDNNHCPTPYEIMFRKK